MTPRHNNGYFKELMETNRKSQITRSLEKEFPDVISKLFGPTAVYDDTGYMYLQIFVVPKALRGNGLATSYIKRLISLCEKEGIDIFLTPDASYQPKDGMTKNELIKWYEKLGFEKKHRDDFRQQATYCYYTKGHKCYKYYKGNQ